MKFTVTLNQATQIGPSEWTVYRTSRVFDSSLPLDRILTWAKAEGIRNATVNDLQFSDFTGESL